MRLADFWTEKKKVIMIKILFLGDVVAKGGRKVLRDKLQQLLRKTAPSIVVANGENAAGGFGLDLSTCDELFASGIQYITSGNHIWKKKEIITYLKNKSDRVLRPANYPDGAPGAGYLIHTFANGKTIGIANLIGRLFMNDLVDCPFHKAKILIEGPLSDCDYTLFDFHAEATSEKVAMGMYLDGKVSAVVGTHTHIQTADERVLPGGTAFITDVGMCGPLNSVIGMEKEAIIRRFMTGMSGSFSAVTKGAMCINGVVITLDEESGKALTIERVFEVCDQS
jgi:2',3'-cyclic-nucleotide 2'-phosphodiesterase